MAMALLLITLPKPKLIRKYTKLSLLDSSQTSSNEASKPNRWLNIENENRHLEL